MSFTFAGCTAAVLTILFAFTASLSAETWTRFRGPNGSGISQQLEYPADLTNEKALEWKTPVRQGKSSPVLSDRHIFVTAFEDQTLYVQCYDRFSGRLLWERGEKRPGSGILHKLNEPSSITPVTDGENVYIFFRDVGLLSYNPEGKLRWRTPLGPFTNAEGISAAPIIAGNRLIVLVDQRIGGSYIAAFDISNGEALWKTPRPHVAGWATPLIRGKGDGEIEIVTVADRHFDGYSATSGRHVWSHAGLSPAVVASPVIEGTTVFAFSYGYETDIPFEQPLSRSDRNKDGVIQADEIGGDSWLYQLAWYKGDRDGTLTRGEWDAAMAEIKSPSSLTAFRLDDKTAGSPGRELWRHTKSFIGVVPSPILYQDVLYVVKNGGILTAFDPETGDVIKTGRLGGAIEGYFASPVAADGKLYFVSEAGKVAIVQAGRDWKVLSVHPLGEDAYATPALSQGRIFIRTAEYLYCFSSAITPPKPPSLQSGLDLLQ